MYSIERVLCSANKNVPKEPCILTKRAMYSIERVLCSANKDVSRWIRKLKAILARDTSGGNRGGKFSTNLSPSGRIRQVQNTTSCHNSGTTNLNSIVISTVRGHAPYKYPPRNTMWKSPGTYSNPLRISWSDTSFSPTSPTGGNRTKRALYSTGEAMISIGRAQFSKMEVKHAGKLGGKEKENIKSPLFEEAMYCIGRALKFMNKDLSKPIQNVCVCTCVCVLACECVCVCDYMEVILACKEKFGWNSQMSVRYSIYYIQ